MKAKSLYVNFKTFNLIFALASGLIILMFKPVGVFYDSVYFLQLAQNLANGNGFTNAKGIFVSHWPPLYPLSLAAIMKLFAINAQSAALLISSIGFGLSIYLFNLMLHRRELNTSVIFIFDLFLLFSYVGFYFTAVYTETLFIPVILAVFYFFEKYLDTQKTYFLILSALLAAFSYLIRYTGYAIIASLFILTFIYRLKNWNLKLFIKETLIISLPAILAVFGWSAIIIAHTNGNAILADRKSNFQPLLKEHWIFFGNTLTNWLMPQTPEKLKYFFILILALSLAFFAIKKRLVLRNSLIFIYPGIVAFIYISFILIALMFFDHNAYLFNRLTLPAYIFFLLFIPAFKLTHLHTSGKIYISLIVSILLLSHFSFFNINLLKNRNAGFNSKEYQNLSFKSELNKLLKVYKVIRTNSPMYITYISNGKVLGYAIPYKCLINAPNCSKPNKNLNLEHFKEKLQKDPYPIVMFSFIKRYDYLSITEVKKLFCSDTDYYKIRSYRDGIIITSKYFGHKLIQYAQNLPNVRTIYTNKPKILKKYFSNEKKLKYLSVKNIPKFSKEKLSSDYAILAFFSSVEQKKLLLEKITNNKHLCKIIYNNSLLLFRIKDN